MDNRAWILCTKWTGNDAYHLTEHAAKELKSSGFHIKLDKTERSGVGTMEFDPDGFIHYAVGVKEIFQNPRRLFPIHEALAPVVSCFHEVCGHGGQWRHEAQKDEPLSKVLLLNDLACQSSPQFYGIDPLYREPMPRYFRQPHETAAQYMGLKMAQKFLTAVYDGETAEKLLCEYTNLRLASGNEFISSPADYTMEKPATGRKPYMKPTEPFTSMIQVYDQFQKDFVKQVFAPADYRITKDSNDLVSDYVNDKKWPWERSWSRKQINQFGDRLSQVFILSGIWLEKHDYCSWIRELPVFKSMEFPKNLSEFIRNVPDHPKEDKLKLNSLTEDDINFARAVEDIPIDAGRSL